MSTLFDLNEPIGLWELPLSPKDYEAACFGALTGEDVLVFVDTNVLSASFRLHQEAREGLFKLLRIPLAAKRLVVPAWVANEYVHNAFKASKTSHAFRESELEKLRTSLPVTKNLSAVLHQVASDRDMEKIAKRLKVPPAQASQALNERVDQITNALRDAGSDLAIDAVHNELLTELRGAFVSNDLGKIARLVAEQAAYRRSSRIPPGLTDSAKGEASENEEAAGNAEGDLAIWLELLQLASERVSGHPKGGDGSHLTSVLFVTQEKKEDFLYRPRKRLSNAEKGARTEENKDIRLIDPRLVAEFEHRIGHRRIAFANLESIASGALAAVGDREFQDSVGMFIAAMRKQKRIAESKAESSNGTFNQAAEEKVQEGQQDTLPHLETTAPPAILDEPPTTTSADELNIPRKQEELFIPDALLIQCTRLGSLPEVSKSTQLFANLLSENKRAQDNAIQRLQLIGFPETIESSFAIGRATCIAMQHDSPKAIALFSSLNKGSLPSMASEQAFLAGALFEAFFESQRQMRNTLLREGLPLLLDQVSQPGWEPARDFIHAQLVPFTDRFFWIPGGELHTLEVRVDYVEQDDVLVVSDVVASYPGKADISLLKGKQSGLQSSYMASTMNFATLDAAMSRLSLLPDELVKFSFNGPELGRRVLTIPETMFVNTELVSVPLAEWQNPELDG